MDTFEEKHFEICETEGMGFGVKGGETRRGGVERESKRNGHSVVVQEKTRNESIDTVWSRRERRLASKFVGPEYWTLKPLFLFLKIQN